MKRTAFRKILSANDVGATGGHQGGVLIPKREQELLDFLPPLDPSVKNPHAWLDCIDPDGTPHRFKFIYYNNKLHDPKGTRNEYRITYMTAWFRGVGARENDIFEIARGDGVSDYTVSVVPASHDPELDNALPVRLQLRGWRRVH